VPAPAPFRSVFFARGHLLDSGLLSRALDVVLGDGASYRIGKLDVGVTRDGESVSELEVSAASSEVFERVRAHLMSMGFSELHTEPAQMQDVDLDGTAPEGFYSTTNLETFVRIGEQWILVDKQRMDAAIAVDGTRARCVKLRDLRRGMRVVVGMKGIRLTPSTSRRSHGGEFEFMAGEVSSERRLAAQVTRVVTAWREVRLKGKKVVLVPGPVVVHVGAVPAFCRLVRSGEVDGVLSGNALAVHDIEAALFGTSLGVSIETGRPVVHGHMHHMRAINRIRRAGSIQKAVEQGVLDKGLMHALVERQVPFVLAGSIRDDGPLPDTRMDLIEAQELYAQLLENAGLVIILGSMLHGIGVGNMIPAEVMTVCVDIHPAVVAKLSDRGSAQSQGIVTDAGAFVAELARQVCG
jgi:lysine-ketoglutarate reductase/saccharopine dehydrogenase-like protein (TIGR00300 family)